LNETELDALLRQALIDARLQDAQSALCELGDAPVLYSDRYRMRERALLQGRIYDGAPAPREAAPAKKPRRLRRTLLVAAIIIAVMGAALVTVNAVNPKWWQALVVNSGEVFFYEDTLNAESADPSAFPPLNEAAFRPEAPLYGLQEKMNKDHPAVPLIPTWLPEGYQETFYREYPYLDSYSYNVCLENGDRSISLCYDYTPVGFDAPQNYYERDPDNQGFIYNTHGINHYFNTNVGDPVVVWRIGCYEGCLAADLPVETVKKIIDSIYTEVEP
jgi:hypothetical protein